jgi:peptide/nickel transport system substrate-binding protein
MNYFRKSLLLALAFFFSLALAQAPDDTTLVIAQSTDASTLDPANIGSRSESNIADHMFGTLYDVNADGEITPYLAESYTVSEDATELTFQLREGLTCHDGEALTAEDVVYTFERAANPDNGFTGNTPGFIFSSIGYQGIRADGDLSVTVTMEKPNEIALGLISEVFIHCADGYSAMTNDQASSTPIGSGPYRFVEWIRDDRIILEKVEEFTLAPGNFQNLIWRVIPEASTRSAELIAGNVDIINNVAPDQVETIDSSGVATIQAVQGTRRIYIGFNQRAEFAAMPGGEAIAKPEVRRALQYAVDVPTICETLLNTTCERATGLVNPPNDNPNLEPYPYDPAMAEQLLDEAGYPRGEDGIRFNIKLQAPNGRYLNDSNVALAVGQYLTDIGVNTEVELMEWSSVYVPLIREHNVGPLFLLGSGGSTWSALYDMSDLSTPDAGTNYTEWNDPEWFAGWDRIAATRDPAEQRVIIDEMLQIFYDRGPWLLMYFQPDFYGVSNRITWEARRDEKIDVLGATLK